MNSDSNLNSAPFAARVPNNGQTNNNSGPGKFQIQSPSVSLPKGGGAIKGIDEKFSVNAINGTAAFSIPIPVSNARGFSPGLSLSYNSGNGNGIFGLGWSLDTISIRRKTEKELPRYRDEFDSDTFIFSQAEDLVPEFKKDNAGNWVTDADGNFIKNESDSADGLFTIRRYKPRIEGLFARIERWAEKSSGLIHWRSISPTNITSIYGKSNSAQISDPKDATKIFEWFLEFTYDDKGNCTVYEYKKEDAAGQDKSNLHNKNRINGNALFTNTYLKRIRYGNISPYTSYTAPTPTQFFFETVFDYGENDLVNAPFPEINPWAFRQDAFSEYRPGFEIRTCRLCNRILLFHHFDELSAGSALVRSMNFTYDNNDNESFTFLKEITETGFIKNNDNAYSQKSLPPINFEYQKHEWNKEIKFILQENLLNAPSGLDEPKYQFIDLFSEGLSGILTEQANGWFYKSNWGNGNFTAPKLVNPKPSLIGLQNSLQISELEADGTKQLISWHNKPEGFFELNDDEEWSPFQAFDNIPNINFSDSNVRFIDLDGDGRADILISEDDVFTWYSSEGKEGFSFASKLTIDFDEEKSPAIIFKDEKQTIFLADMSGDGLTDIVRIRNGEVCYWPNLGYGNFGAKISMDAAPVFDYPDQFNPSFIHLADLDGSGTSDIVYLGENEFRLWLNHNGNGFSEEPVSIDPFFEITGNAKISVIDLLGTGMSCITWNSNLPNNIDKPLQYIDLFNSKKPHLMVSYKNNLGKEVFLEYAASTQFYIADKLAGTPWVTKLPFPIQCLAKVSINDVVAGTYFSNSYSYHHGYYDHAEREFRGFGRVEQTDTEEFENFILSGANNIVEEDVHQPPVKTITWFHTGAYFNQQKIIDQFSHEYNIGSFEFELPQPVLTDGLSAVECREALRACKGMMLRQEIYALDGSALASNPYSVAKKNNIIKWLQPKQRNKYAVFYVHESESLSFSYERNMSDPRIAHLLNLEVDDFGNVLKSASVVYGRKTKDAQLPQEIQGEQSAAHIVFTENNFTNDFDLPDIYRLKLSAEAKSYEITNSKYNAIQQFNINDLLNDFATAVEINYEAVPNGSLQKRMIEDAQTIYLSNDLVTVLPLGQMDTKAFVYQSYKLAFTPSLITHLFGTKVTGQMLQDAKYVQLNDPNWWISSGRNRYLDNGETIDNAQQRFYFPVAVIDPFDIETKLFYDQHNLFLVKTEDALQNSNAAETIDYRLLQPTRLKDLNDNISEMVADELGMVIATSMYGDEADGMHGDQPLSNYITTAATDLAEVISNPNKFLQKATSFFYYDLFAWANRNQPVCFANISRETHESELSKGNSSKVFLCVGYSNGLGQNLQTKIQAEPGNALLWENGEIKTIDTSPNLRWVGNGRTVLNNKGNPVKQYEPFFSSTYEYESENALVEIGFSSILYYDPLGRAIKVEHANGTFSKIEFDPWKQLSFDENDTVLESGWYSDRGSPDPSAPEPTDADQRAAWLAAKHANTPAQIHLDSLGRKIFSIADNGSDGKYATRTIFDIENNQRQVIDARNNIVMQYDYDMISRQVHHINMDGGERFMFTDTMNKPFYAWDSRNHRFRNEYDSLHRPTNHWLLEDVTKDITEKLIGLIVYGENQVNDKQLNLRGKMFQSYDQSGMTQTTEYDFKENVKNSFKQLASEYKKTIDWNLADKNPLLDYEKFNSSSLFNAMNRLVEMQLPDNSKIMPLYNEADLLEQVNVSINGQQDITQFVQNIDYNAKAQREKILYGNNTATNYSYDEKTYRLTRLLTTRNKGADTMQDLNYFFDPVGNITEIIDKAQQTIYFNNAAVDPGNKFEYDAIYRLTYTQGREHVGQNAPCDQFDTDKTQAGGSRLVMPGDMNAMQRYEQQYQYDAVGNIMKMIHNAGNGIFSNKWTRVFNCSTTNNQLNSTQVGADITNYNYDAHGNMLNLQNGSFGLTWDYADQLQQLDLGGGGTAYYVYDVGGERVRKVIESNATTKERVYLAAYERYRETQNGSVQLERESLHIMDDKRRIALVETRKQGTDAGLPFLIRYQYGNHLGTACLELDDMAQIISYEEYYPFGSTSYQAMRNQTDMPKRYRYVGKERDEESGLNYYGARYYAPWLCRWAAVDPIGIAGGINMYNYAKSNPIIFVDLNGKQPTIAPPAAGAAPAQPPPTQLQINYVEGIQAAKNLANKIRAKGYGVNEEVTAKGGKGGSRIDVAPDPKAPRTLPVTFESKLVNLNAYRDKSGNLNVASITALIGGHVEQVLKHQEALRRGVKPDLPFTERLVYTLQNATSLEKRQFERILRDTAKNSSVKGGAILQTQVIADVPELKSGSTPNIPAALPDTTATPNIPAPLPNTNATPNIPTPLPNTNATPNIPPPLPNTTLTPNIPPNIPSPLPSAYYLPNGRMVNAPRKNPTVSTKTIVVGSIIVVGAIGIGILTIGSEGANAPAAPAEYVGLKAAAVGVGAALF